MRKITPLLIVLLLLVGALSSGHAQDDPASPTNNLLDLLALVPNTLSVRDGEFITYSDLQAIEGAYDTTMPRSLDLLPRDNQDANNPYAVWWRVFRNLYIPGDFASYFLQIMVDEVGFEPLAVNRTISYSAPPGNATILAGDFDTEAVSAAYTEMGFSSERTLPYGELWCGAVGCTEGMQTNLAERNTANPFGGALGRQQPMIISPSYLMSSADLAVVQEHIHAATDERDSLADLPRYRAAVEAVSQDEVVVLQATFIDMPFLLHFIMPPLGFPSMLAGAGYDNLRAAIEAQLVDQEDLPPATLLLLADVMTEDEQIARLGLVYDNPDQAKTAIRVIINRLNSYDSLATNQSFAELITQRHASLRDGGVYSAENGLYVAVIELVSARATAEEILALNNFDDTPQVAAPAMLYRFLYQTFIMRDVAWLSSIPRGQLEALLAELDEE